ncbi:MAG: efflux RND transporter periplasmic adaptor subunit [Pseudacidovorax sp.]|nr:efflux RND transporter periplasmic adaptor subunit [Pseudacidovorax sp.]
MSDRRKTLPLLAIVAGLVVVGLIGWGFWRASRPAPEVFQGQMEAKETDIAAKIPGRIAEVMVREGDRIEAGAPILRMASPEVDAKLAQATAAQQAAQAVAKKAENGARPQEIEMARMQWQRAETAAELARKSFARVDGLAREGLVAAQKRDEAEANWKASRDAAIAARAQYDLARQGARGEDKAAAEAQAAKAETELRSPVAGEVAKVLARAGELVPQGVAAVTVVDLADQWVVLNVREDRLSRFAVGQEFEARLPALGPQAATARFKVTYSAPLPDFATWRATRAGAGFDVRTFEVRAKPLQPIAGARPGMSVLVD